MRDELQSLRSLLCYVNRIIAKCSPIAIVQRYSRGWLARRRLKAEGITLRRYCVLQVYPFVMCLHSTYVRTYVCMYVYVKKMYMYVRMYVYLCCAVYVHICHGE